MMTLLRRELKNINSLYLLVYPIFLSLSFIIALTSNSKSNPFNALFILMYLFVFIIMVIYSFYSIVKLVIRPYPSKEDEYISIKKNISSVIVAICWVLVLFACIYLSVSILSNFSVGKSVSGIFTRLDHYGFNNAFQLLYLCLFVGVIHAIVLANFCMIIVKQLFSKYRKPAFLFLFLILEVATVMMQINLLPKMAIIESEVRNIIAMLNNVFGSLSNILPYFALSSIVFGTVYFVGTIALIYVENKKNA